MSNLKTAKHPKVRPFLEYFSQSLPKVQERKFTRLTWIFKKSSQLQCLLMSLKNRKNASLCSIRSMFRVLGIYNFGLGQKSLKLFHWYFGWNKSHFEKIDLLSVFCYKHVLFTNNRQTAPDFLGSDYLEIKLRAPIFPV